ncbi:UNVERIFIED_CONTAM: Histone-lysine N-methyltransferase, H3 lysine-9 specific SUVH1 [Sesamum radiatum]|uniref:Histone-lysine N-methyltransferase, H3 lysine-9 specific SUVH1 n=1 Tax=Sesamum radiatum TaxID=300843 RepID=A0AAW2LER2_SESRA
MEQGLGSDSNAPPGSIDKSRVLDVRPLRSLVPVFPSPQGMSSVSTPQPPFVCVPPSGPFPSGVQPFYPFLVQNDSQRATGGQNQPRSIVIEDDGYSDSQNHSDQYGFSMHVTDAEDAINSFLTVFKLKEFDDFRRSSGDKDTVGTILLAFDLLRRRLTQLEEAKDLAPGIARRPDLKAATLLMTKGVRTNSTKRLVIGQGGVQRRDGQMFDQKLERGNLALEKSLHRANDESWVEKNKSGCNVFKYKLVRVPGQPAAFSLWKSIQQWKDGTATRTGIILPDLTSGAESLPVALVNDVDGEKGPAHFTYVPSLKYSQPFSAPKPSTGCHCLGGCQPGDTHCPCSQKNDGFLPYSSLGVLFTNKSLIYECGLTCACPPNCRSRMSQAGIKVRLEVFKTKNRGWGLKLYTKCVLAAVLRESNSDVFLHIAFFAIRHIPPMQELTYDYGIVPPEKADKGKKKCLCGSVKCRGYFY